MEKRKTGSNLIGPASYEFNISRVFNDIKENSSGNDFMYTMGHLYRSRIVDPNPKSIHDTSKVLNAKHHINLGCINGHARGHNLCKIQRVDMSDGYGLHYRIGWKVSDHCRDRKCVIKDQIILKFKTRLEIAMKNALANIFQNNIC